MKTRILTLILLTICLGHEQTGELLGQSIGKTGCPGLAAGQ